MAVDGLRFAGLETLLSSSQPGRVLDVHAFRRDELYQCRVTLAEAPPDTAWLSVDAGASAQAAAARAAWFGTAGPPV
jgi:predicted metalloprotease with PDZ domain